MQKVTFISAAFFANLIAAQYVLVEFSGQGEAVKFQEDQSKNRNGAKWAKSDPSHTFGPHKGTNGIWMSNYDVEDSHTFGPLKNDSKGKNNWRTSKSKGTRNAKGKSNCNAKPTSAAVCGRIVVKFRFIKGRCKAFLYGSCRPKTENFFHTYRECQSGKKHSLKR